MLMPIQMNGRKKRWKVKREEVVEAIEKLTSTKLPSESVEQRISDVTNLHAIVEAMDIVKVILQGLPDASNAPAEQAYFSTVHVQLLQLIQKLPSEESRAAVTTIFHEKEKRFRGYKDYTKYDADVTEFCRVVLMAYIKQRTNAIIANKKEAQHV